MTAGPTPDEARERLAARLAEGHDDWVYDFPIDLAEARALMAEVERLSEVLNGDTMTTYRPADPAKFVTEWTWQTTLDWAHDAAEWEPVEIIEERWVLVERKTCTVRGACSVIGCDADATHWGLCETHARTDDPTAFTDPEAAS